MSTSSRVLPHLARTSLTASGRATMAKSQTALPSMWKYCNPSSMASWLMGLLVPPAGISITSAPLPSAFR